MNAGMGEAEILADITDPDHLLDQPWMQPTDGDARQRDRPVRVQVASPLVGTASCHRSSELATPFLTSAQRGPSIRLHFRNGSANTLGMDAINALSAANFESRLRDVRSEHLTLSTPCSDWDVRALVNQVLLRTRMSVQVLAGTCSNFSGTTPGRGVRCWLLRACSAPGHPKLWAMMPRYKPETSTSAAGRCSGYRSSRRSGPFPEPIVRAAEQLGFDTPNRLRHNQRR